MNQWRNNLDQKLLAQLMYVNNKWTNVTFDLNVELILRALYSVIAAVYFHTNIAYAILRAEPHEKHKREIIYKLMQDHKCQKLWLRLWCKMKKKTQKFRHFAAPREVLMRMECDL